MRAVVLQRAMNVEENPPGVGGRRQLVNDTVEVVHAIGESSDSPPDIPVAQVNTMVYSSASHRCVIQGVPSTIDVSVKYSTEGNHKYVGMVLSPKTFHSSPLYCGLVSHNVQEAPVVLCGIVFPTFKEPLLLVLYETAGEFEQLRRMAKMQAVMDEEKVTIIGEIPTLHGDMKYGRLECGGLLRAMSPSHEVGVEMRLVLDQPSGEGVEQSIVRLTLLAFGDHTWHPMEISLVSVQKTQDSPGRSMGAYCRNKSLIEYHNWSVDTFHVTKNAREVIPALETVSTSLTSVSR